MITSTHAAHTWHGMEHRGARIQTLPSSAVQHAKAIQNNMILFDIVQNHKQSFHVNV